MEDKRLIHHHLSEKDTYVYFFADHELGKTQLMTLKAMHGEANIKIIGTGRRPRRYESFDEWKNIILKRVHQQNVVGIYFVIKTEWRERFVNDYIQTGKVNGALIGWFIGFGNSDRVGKKSQSLAYIWRGNMLKFKIEETFGRTPIVRNRKNNNDLKKTPQRPIKSLQGNS